MASFFTYFTSAFGMLVLVAIFVSFVVGQRIDLGAFGLIGFPLLAFLYALVRKATGKTVAVEATLAAKKLNDVYEHPRYAEFLSEDIDRKYIYKEDLPEQFSDWLESENPYE